MQLTGNFIDYFIVFWAGVLTSFTPCVYPVMPLTASFIGSLNAKGSKWTGFFISLAYVFGMALMYAGLGVLAGLTGKFFGSIQNNPIVFIIIGIILLVFSAGIFDLIPMPTFSMNNAKKKKLTSIWSIIFVGMVAGLMISPCTAPILGSLLLYIATKQNLLYGASLLFVFSYGVGASLILVGTFSNILARLPKSGSWLLWVKRFCGLVVFIYAVLMLYKGIILIKG